VRAAAAQDMLVSYGISIDKDAEAKERVKHTAARVGLAVSSWDEHGALMPDAPPPAADGAPRAG
jgi:hypothetical protein